MFYVFEQVKKKSINKTNYVISQRVVFVYNHEVLVCLNLLIKSS